jgi:hypothetical protein
VNSYSTQRMYDQETHLIASRDHNVRASKEVGYGGGMGVEKTLPRLWDTVAAPVHLNKLGELTLIFDDQVKYMIRSKTWSTHVGIFDAYECILHPVYDSTHQYSLGSVTCELYLPSENSSSNSSNPPLPVACTFRSLEPLS